MRCFRAVVVLAAVALVATGCAPEPAPRPTVAPTQAAPTPAEPDVLDGMSLAQRSALLFMVGTPVAAADPTTLDAVRSGVAGVFLHGRSDAGADATAQLAAQFTALRAADAPPLWVATDQEGGDVQVLSGEGFESMPTALTQARNGCDPILPAASVWGAQLAAAGITMNLAPVVDIVSSPESAQHNAPIGQLNRHYGYDQQTVAACAGGFAQGMRQAGILPTLKHFPGLGRTNANTDYADDVVDTEVTASSADVEVYRTLLAQGESVVMMSSAVYQGIDPTGPAVFSPQVVDGLLRGDVGFDGVIMTDDLSAPAQVKRWAPADRAVRAIRAGVDLVLVSADPSVFPEMHQAVIATARTDSAFAEQVDAAARRILQQQATFPAE